MTRRARNVKISRFLECFLEPTTSVRVSRKLEITQGGVIKRIKRFEKLGILQKVGETKTVIPGFYWQITPFGRYFLDFIRRNPSLDKVVLRNIDAIISELESMFEKEIGGKAS